MDYLEKYTIAFGGLSEGTYEYAFLVNDVFFEKFNDSPIESGSVEILITLIKKKHITEMFFDINGVIKTECDRCLEMMDLPVSYSSRLILKTGVPGTEENEELVYITPTQNEIDISQYIYEFVLLSLPVRRIHPEDKKGKSKCNPEMLKKIESHSFRSVSTNDARWDDLKKLLN